MEPEPKFKIGEKVYFTTNSKETKHGTVVMITPVNYSMKYTIRTETEEKKNVDEKDIELEK
jgi:hypothetical protein